jgi:hypothetical protein
MLMVEFGSGYFMWYHVILLLPFATSHNLASTLCLTIDSTRLALRADPARRPSPRRRLGDQMNDAYSVFCRPENCVLRRKKNEMGLCR